MQTELQTKTIDYLSDLVGEANLTFEGAALSSGSKDSYHFSPILLDELSDKCADIIVRPENSEQLKRIISYAVKHDIPITPRGAGTGNYGQGIPIKGGILVNTKRMNKILKIDHESATVECGTVLWQIEKHAAEHDAELRIFPSTMPTSSSAGFITGGSGGIGSITWGMLSDNGNVRSVKMLSCEEEPKELTLDTQESIRDVLHNCGLTAFVTEVEFALAPKKAWRQYVFAFDDLLEALEAGEQFTRNENFDKRLCSVFEWPIPSYFLPLVKKEACPEGKTLLFIITSADAQTLSSQFTETSALLTFQGETTNSRESRGFQIYDFTWNHTTMWAMKSDKTLTYLQDAFDITQYQTQIRARKEKFGDDVLVHAEFIKSQDDYRLGGLSIVKYRDKEYLYELIEFCEEIGMTVANPHTHYLDADIRWFGNYLLDARKRWDPKGLLNPGHLLALEEPVAS